MADAKVQEDVPKDSVNPINCEEEKVEESMDVNIENGLGQRTGFSSENFKIEIANLPRFFGVSQAKKFLMKTMGLKVHKIKPCGKKATWMFVNFANEEDRELAIAKLDGFKLKGHKLRAFKAKAAKDPMAKKAAASDQEEQVDDRPVDEQLKAAVCPLSDQSYCDQLKAKTEIVKDLMANLRKEFMKSNGFFKDHGITEATLAKLEPFVPSPVTQGYRNKCEFTVGLHPETKKATVGFRLASYKKGSVAVVGIDHLPMVSDVMKKVVKHFENFVLASGYEPFDNIGQSGYWKQLTVREGQRTGDLLVWAISHPQNLSEDDKSALKDKLKKHFSETTVDDVPQVTSLSVQFLGRRVKGEPDPPIELLHGQPSIRESLMGLSFKISPQAFFQVNTEAAEILYKTVGEIANLDKDTVAFDVCCGTGTIGLCLADKAKHVDGLDIIEEAVEDANANAKANGVINATFHAGGNLDQYILG